MEGSNPCPTVYILPVSPRTEGNKRHLRQRFANVHKTVIHKLGKTVHLTRHAQIDDFQIFAGSRTWISGVERGNDRFQCARRTTSTAADRTRQNQWKIYDIIIYHVIIITIIITRQFIRRSNTARVTTRAPYNVRCSYSAKQLVSEVGT